MLDYHLNKDIIIAITMHHYQVLDVTDTFLYLIWAFIVQNKKYHIYLK